MRKGHEYIAPIGWLSLLVVIIVFSIELISTYIGTQGHIEAIGGMAIILSLFAALSITAIAVGARYRPSNKKSFDNYHQA